MERLRRIRDMDERHHLTLMCRDLSEIAPVRERGQRAVPAAQARHARQLHVHPARDARGAAPPAARRAQDHRRARPEPSGGARAARGADEPMLSSTLLLPGDGAAADRRAGDPRRASSTRSTS